MGDRGHVGIKRGHDVPAALDHRDVQAAVSQVLGHLQSNEAAAYYHRGCGARGFNKTVNLKRVLDGAQGEDAFVIDAGQVGDDGMGAG